MNDLKMSELVDLSDDSRLFEVNKKRKERATVLVNAGKAMLEKNLIEKARDLGLSKEDVEAILSNDDISLNRETLGKDEK